MTAILPAIKSDLERDGYAIYPGFFDNELVCELQAAVEFVIRAVASPRRLYPMDGHDIAVNPMGPGIITLACEDRKLVATIYDTIRQVPPLHRMVTQTEGLFREIRGYYARPAIAEGGTCIRIDLPGEDAFRSNWHQEYPYQGRSKDGLAFWSPLLPITPQMGPVQIAVGSHKHGELALSDDKPEGYKAGYARVLEDEAAIIQQHRIVAPCLQPTDLMVMDYVTLHRSGENRSSVPRWAALWRYFNLAEPSGIADGWKKRLPA